MARFHKTKSISYRKSDIDLRERIGADDDFPVEQTTQETYVDLDRIEIITDHLDTEGNPIPGLTTLYLHSGTEIVVVEDFKKMVKLVYG